MTRSDQQNKAMHVYFRLLADALNDAGLDIRKVMKEGVDIPWTEHTTKQLLWSQIMNTMYPDKDSTAQLESDEVDKIYEVVNRAMAKHGVHVPFPDITNKLEKNEIY